MFTDILSFPLVRKIHNFPSVRTPMHWKPITSRDWYCLRLVLLGISVGLQTRCGFTLSHFRNCLRRLGGRAERLHWLFSGDVRTEAGESPWLPSYMLLYESARDGFTTLWFHPFAPF